jgi:cell division protein FtsB
MSIKPVLGVLLLTGAIVLAILQRSALSRAGQQNEELRRAREETARLTRDNGGIPRLVAEHQEIEALRTGNEDLLKLRNEVRQLRDQVPEVERLRRENHRLSAEIKLLADSKPLAFAQMEGYLAKETWSNTGFTTPEAALQTWFWSIREGQFENVAECISPEERPRFQKNYSQNWQEARKRFQEGIGLAHMAGYRIAEKEQGFLDKAYVQASIKDAPADENRLTLSVQGAAGGAIIKWHLQRFANEWKIEDW